MSRHVRVQMAVIGHTGILAFNIGDAVSYFIGIDGVGKLLDILSEPVVMLVTREERKRKATLGNIGKFLINGQIFFLVRTVVAQRVALGIYRGSGIIGQGRLYVLVQLLLQVTRGEVLPTIAQEVVQRRHILRPQVIIANDFAVILDGTLQKGCTVFYR